MANNNLTAARKAKKDEFYTGFHDVVTEVSHYKKHFKGKVVYFNCDDPEESNFWRYFEKNFEHLGLKKLIAVHYSNTERVYKLELTTDRNGDGIIDGKDLVKTELTQNGDFRSSESIELLKEADIVVTNPPFSLFREYIAQLMEYDKKFLIVGNNNALTYKEVFPLIKDNKIWLGVGSNLSMVYRSPYKNVLESNRKFVERKRFDPDTHIKVPAISWFTNLEHFKRNKEIMPYKKYSKEKYPKYVNHPAIEVGDVKDIPVDYKGVMAVPITFLSKFNPDQFEILGCFDIKSTFKVEHGFKNLKWYNNGEFKKDNVTISNYPLFELKEPPAKGSYYVTEEGKILKKPFSRIIIKRNKEIVSYKKYNEEDYPKYDNYNAINVDKVKDIPVDYEGIIGVPITFLCKYNPEEFEILGQMATTKITEDNFGYPYLNGKKKFARILIKRK